VTPKAQLKRKQNERNQTHKLDYTKWNDNPQNGIKSLWFTFDKIHVL
jgi:hypothetical protein